jgi:predicted nucleotidyltransferase
MERDPILKNIVDKLVSTFQPDRIYLFGSKAKGEDTAHSDYDLMVVVNSSNQPSYKRSQLAYQSLIRIGTAVDVLVWTKSAFDSRLHLKASFPSTIVREGRLLYAA